MKRDFVSEPRCRKRVGRLSTVKWLGRIAGDSSLPGQWRGHRGASPRTGRIGRDCGRPSAVAQVVDVDLPARALFEDRGRVLARGVLSHRLRDGLAQRISPSPNRPSA